MSFDPRTIRIGEILIYASMLSKPDLEEALDIATQTGQMIGEVLKRSGFVTDEQLKVALKAQEQMRKGNLTLDAAISTLHLAVKYHITFEQAASQLGYTTIR
jgi:hypothetical protein